MTDLQQAALRIAASNRERSVEELRRLVRIPSPTGEEGEAQAHVAGMLRGLDAETVVEEPDMAALFARFPLIAQYPTHWQHDLILPYEELPTYEGLRASGLESVLNYRSRPNVVGVFRGSGGGRSLILNGHIDTVTVEPRREWDHEPYGAEIVDGCMFGRGTSDMKGGLMAALLAMAYLREAGIDLRGDVIVQSVVNEEHAGNGTLDLVRRGWRADAAIVLEPTGNLVAVSHYGGLYWQVTVPGRPRAPGARWERGVQQGVSAIEKLPHVIDALIAMEGGYNARTETILEPGMAPFSLVMGKVAGGHYETVTASEAVLRGGAYFAPTVGTVHDVMSCFRSAVAASASGDTFLGEHPPRLEFLHHDDSTQQSAGLPVALGMAQVLASHGAADRIGLGAFACDMRHLVNQGGIPSIVFGPGSVAHIHKPDEQIEIRQYLECIDYLIEFVCNWCNREPEGDRASRR
ncbi:MAG TPA: M20/M25/M40 family metallo-hydrolase [Casimicrobiaceae bacterium]|nr:M20/M25/M40 family metallo-hydrolase [Casimicrobiaceae bacterium]